MRVYLVRHGEAKSAEQDPERPLTERGANDVRRVIGSATELEPIAVEQILHSGKARARQTAEAWGDALGAPVSEAPGLAPLDDPSIWADQLADATGSLMLVGHLPHLAEIAGRLLGEDAEERAISFPAGGLVGLERGVRGWSVRLVVPLVAE